MTSTQPIIIARLLSPFLTSGRGELWFYIIETQKDSMLTQHDGPCKVYHVMCDATACGQQVEQQRQDGKDCYSNTHVETPSHSALQVCVTSGAPGKFPEGNLPGQQYCGWAGFPCLMTYYPGEPNTIEPSDKPVFAPACPGGIYVYTVGHIEQNLMVESLYAGVPEGSLTP